MASSDAFTRQRRSLNILSVAFIVFFVAGGEFGDSINVPYFGIKIEKVFIIQALLWVGFVYFYIRFLQLGVPTKRGWHLDRVFEISRDPTYQKLLKFPDNHSESEVPQISREFFLKRQYNWRRHHKLTESRADFRDWREGTLYKSEWLPIKRSSYIFPGAKAYFRAIFKHPGWFEYVLPQLLGVFAVVLAAWDRFNWFFTETR